jgi:hypothetical protein
LDPGLWPLVFGLCLSLANLSKELEAKDQSPKTKVQS